MKLKNRFQIFCLYAALTGFLLLGAVLAYTPKTQATYGAEDPLVQDAQEYASDQNVPLEEAVNRLELQDLIGRFIADITWNERETFAGAWLQHTPDFGVIIQFTKDGEQVIEHYFSQEKYAGLRDLVELRTAKITLQELEATQRKIGLTARALGIPFESGINVFENQVEFYVTDPTSFQKSLEAAGVAIPDYVLLITISGFSEPESSSLDRNGFVISSSLSCNPHLSL